MPAIDAGELDARILIGIPQVLTDAFGGQLPAANYIFVAHPWAKVTEVTTRGFLNNPETMKDGELQTDKRATFQIRFREIGPTARVTWRDQAYDIIEVTGTKRGGYTYLHCRSVIGAN